MTYLREMEVAADTDDAKAFMIAYDKVDWSTQSAPNIEHAVRMALLFKLTKTRLVARNLSALGASVHPNHNELQKMAWILASPKADILRSIETFADIGNVPRQKQKQAKLS